MENPKFMSYNMARIDEDEFECLRKLGETTSTLQKKVENNNNNFISNYTKMVRIDEDELECLRKLGETTPYQKVESHKFTSNYTKMVRIDEDELESLRRLEESSITSDQKVGIRPCNNIRPNNNKIALDKNVMSKDVQPPKNMKKLESKKSEDINDSAEKFIQNFKKQLILQRLESIENVEQMLARGV